MFLGTWRGLGLPPERTNAVYGYRDKLGRYNRRFFTEDRDDNVVMGGAYDARKTACGHADVDYIRPLQGLAAAEVKARVMLELPDYIVISDADDKDDAKDEKDKKDKKVNSVLADRLRDCRPSLDRFINIQEIQ